MNFTEFAHARKYCYVAENGFLIWQITPQYLNRIVKCQTDKTAYEWICLSLVGEIAKLLENTNDTMQQIANHLHFPDQVTLTKFFKRQTGYSLSEYRKKLAVK